MFRSLLCRVVLVLLSALPSFSDGEGGPPTLVIGSTPPDFCLLGSDGQTHCLKDYAASKVLVVAFTCNHCLTAQLYETRIKQLAADYNDRGVASVAIEPNNPKRRATRRNGIHRRRRLVENMKTRARYRKFNYLYDGETQKVSRVYGPSATPHLVILDAERKLRYEGRVDSNPRESLVTVKDARVAIDALLGVRTGYEGFYCFE